jgi:hypothetical protein
VASADKTNLAAFKAETGVPMEYASCQTTIGGYFVDGHIPLEAIEWLLTERPRHRWHRAAGHAARFAGRRGSVRPSS